MFEDTTAGTDSHVGLPDDPVPQLQGPPPPTGKMQNSLATAVIASIAMAYGDISSDDDEEEEEVAMEPRPANSSDVNGSHGGLPVDVKPPHEVKMESEVLGEKGQLVDSQVKADEGFDPKTPNMHETVKSTEVAGEVGETTPLPNLDETLKSTEMAGDVGETTPVSSVILNLQEAFSGGTAHRSANTGYDSDGESSDSSSTTVSSGLEEFRQRLEEEDDYDTYKGPMITKGELGLKDLPPIEELTITVTERDRMMFLGTVSGIVEELVVVQSDGKKPALDQDSILFLEGRVVLGQVFEIFGPVAEPYYSVRFNTRAEIEAKGITIGLKVYFTPERQDLFHPVNVTELRKIKGSDASWEANNEPPPKFVEYSDDEEERKAKKTNKGKGQGSEEQKGHCAGRKRNRQERGEFPSTSESDGSDDDEMQTFSGPHWPPRHPNRQQASSQPRFGHPRHPRQRHRGPRPGFAGHSRQESFQPRSSPGPRFSPQPLMGTPPRFQARFPTPHQGRPYMDPGQQWVGMSPPMPPGAPGDQFVYQGQNVYDRRDVGDRRDVYDGQDVYDEQDVYDVEDVYQGQNIYQRQNVYQGQDVYGGQDVYDGHNVHGPPFGWNSPSNQGHQRGFMPPRFGSPRYPAYPPY